MPDFINTTWFIIYLGIFSWIALFSLIIGKYRGFRNLGMLAAYICLPVMLYVSTLASSAAIWCSLALVSGLLYILSDIIARIKHKEGEISASPLWHGLIAWPIIGPEAIENMLAEYGLLGGKRGNPQSPIPNEGPNASATEQTTPVDSPKILHDQ